MAGVSHGKSNFSLHLNNEPTLGVFIEAGQYGLMTQTPRASRSPIAPEICNLAKAIDLVGDRWCLLILRSALYGVRRFDDFQTELGAPRTVLSGRLKRLTDVGILQRVSYKEPGKRARPEYLLTEMGASLQPILIGLTQWGDRWVGNSDPPISFTHKNGQAIRAGFVDEADRALPASEIRIVIRK